MLTSLLIDFGSTFTKVTLVDLEQEEVIATGRAPTTVDAGIMEGFTRALSSMPGKSLPEDRFYRRACSSAAGGLKMIAIGLIRELTVEAAKQAALGAGARVLAAYAQKLTAADVVSAARLKPDIILLAGGTDGGNEEVVMHNARQLISFPYDLPVIYAGNRVVADRAAAILRRTFQEVVVTANVMPELNRLNIEPVRQTIRELFLQRIVKAKGLSGAKKYAGEIVMPTPAAVLKAVELLAWGTPTEPGIGELVLLDIGGATTDVYSAADGDPEQAGVVRKGLPEPRTKRTVEGDLGMRYSALSLLENQGVEKILSRYCSREPNGINIKNYAGYVYHNPHYLPGTPEETYLETALAAAAVEMATARHAGCLKKTYTPYGAVYLQYGKDLTRVPCLVGTGGIIVEHTDPSVIMTAALFSEEEPWSLRPVKPRMLVDDGYILAAMGLLSDINPEKALRIMKKNLRPL